MAFLAQILDNPTFYVMSLSENTSIPFSISTLLMQNVFKKLALPPAIELTIELTMISLLPVTDFVRFANSFLIKRATETEEPTAAE